MPTMIWDESNAPSGSSAWSWRSICYGNGLFVAVNAYSNSDITKQIMTSPDGITWTYRTAAWYQQWQSVCYGNGLFVAVAYEGAIMTSPDGITWTLQTRPVSNQWMSVCYGSVELGDALFVAISQNGTNNRVMTSLDGITWTSRTSAENNTWASVCYGNGVFVAVASDGTNRVMTSVDGVTWVARSAAAANAWKSVCYGNGLFVAVSSDGTGSGTYNRVMTSVNGTDWILGETVRRCQWSSVCYGKNQFIAVATVGTYTALSRDKTMVSLDGAIWIDIDTESGYANPWRSVCYGNDLFVSVAGEGSTNHIMTSLGLIGISLKSQPNSTLFVPLNGDKSVIIGSKIINDFNDSYLQITDYKCRPDYQDVLQNNE